MEGGYERYWTLQDFFAFNQNLLALRQQAWTPFPYLQYQAYLPQALEPPTKQPRSEANVINRPSPPSASISDSCGLTSFRSCSVAPFTLPSESFSSSSCASSSSSPRPVGSTGDSNRDDSSSSTSRYGPPFKTAPGSFGSAFGTASESATCPLEGCATCPVAEHVWSNPESSSRPRLPPRFWETAGERRTRNAVARNGPNLQRLQTESRALQQALLTNEPLSLPRPTANFLHENPQMGPCATGAPRGRGPRHLAGTRETAIRPAGPPEQMVGRKRRLIEAWQNEQLQ
ncbi:hypothetical protein KFL_009860020 [Klebsormidium nitens]|uniref:Uncharacterized protein n=1 Tax=Klebsormidium nitens TaxID=105231 RepID=A0A1Y1INW2_KLENI|nr:hypothetical protein KFL_009860020 [Klebsormidium nitens]|eukprot:GAQ92343.1 hypothetical protein KFL_009860020 [Klebsormidium nitens]